MKTFTEKDFEVIEENIVSIGVDLSIASSLAKFLNLALNDDLDVNDMDLANLSNLLKQQIAAITEKYDKMECTLGL